MGAARVAGARWRILFAAATIAAGGTGCINLGCDDVRFGASACVGPTDRRADGTGAEVTARPAATYRVWVANESSDLLSLIRFGPEGAAIERDVEVGIMPGDLDGAHGVAVSPDRRHLYVSLAHGTPFGRLWKLDAATGALLDSVTLGSFPATIGLTPDGSRAFVVNFDLHGDPVPSTVSAVFTPAMQEEKRIEACVRPHGSRVNHAGTRHYTVCVGSDQLVEISTERLAVRRRMDLAPGREAPLTASGEPLAGPEPTAATGDDPAPSAAPPGGGTGAACGPTWVIPSHDDARLFVACNRSGEVLEIDAETLRPARRFHGGTAPYNLAATSDGRLLLATNKGDGSVSVFVLETGEEAARIRTSRRVTHGVVVSPDDRYAFVSNEAVGATRGTVDVIDLQRLERVGSTEVHHQPGGIDFWRMEAAAP